MSFIDTYYLFLFQIIGQLLSEEDELKLKYQLEDDKTKRNEGRDVYDNEIIDYIFGEVVYDGKRYHLIIAGIIIFLLLISLFIIIGSNKSTLRKITKKKNN